MRPIFQSSRHISHLVAVPGFPRSRCLVSDFLHSQSCSEFDQTRVNMNQEASASPDPSRPRSQIDSPLPERRPRRLWIWAVVLVLFGLLFYWVITQQNKSPAAAAGAGWRAVAGPVAVSTATARGSMNVYINSIGTVTPVYTASITAQVTGVVTTVHYQEGQYVRQGDSLVDIDSLPYAAQLAEAQGLLERDQKIGRASCRERV